MRVTVSAVSLCPCHVAVASLCPVSFITNIPLKVPISWGCKLAYVAYMVVFGCLGLRWQLFAFSVWIINDQVAKLFLVGML